MRFAIPAGGIAAVATYTAYALARADDVSSREARTLAFMVLLVVALWVLVVLARPFTRFRAALVLAMIAGAVSVLTIPSLRDAFDLTIPGDELLAIGLGCALAGCVLIELATRRIRESTRVADEEAVQSEDHPRPPAVTSPSG
jgi:cation-transporting ATPase E